MPPCRHAAASAWPLLLMLHLWLPSRVACSRSLITIENEKAREIDIDPDEYLWETLPGRCCFDSFAEDCDLCSVWSDPQNFCHTSRESCELCGMALYCPAPPPLLNADKVCTGDSMVGTGCNDDLDTGLCQKTGALAACQSACRHTAHCEMIVLYTDAMAGTCVLCRNMLNYEHTEQASTRVYAVEHLDMHPPSPPGYQREELKHFSILQDPSPPPPPLPPPSPPRSPPPPLPAALGTRTDTHIECEFFDGMDYSIKGKSDASAQATAAQTIDTLADTMRHCCSKCGMHAGCTDFVYEPGSKTCVLMPAVPSYMLKRSPNNSTIAGSVTISRIDQSHAACHFHVGSGYAGGAIGIGRPIPGRPMKSKQDCCDSCDRDERCAKFVFEHYGGSCQLYGPESEHYFTFNLLSGTVDGRATPVVDPRTETQLSADEGEGSPADNEYGEDPYDDESAAPPLFFSFDNYPPPSPPGSEGDVAQTVLADFSLFMGFLIFIGFIVCFCLFFGQDLQNLAFAWTGGRIGKSPKSLLPTRDAGGAALAGTLGGSTRAKKGTLPPGWAKVTVQTMTLNQKKDLEVAGCQLLAELNELIWDEFGHLLNGMRVKDCVLLVWASDESGSSATERWMLVTESSEMAKVIECGAIKLRSKKDIDVKGLAIAFAPSLTHKGKGKKKKKEQRLALKHAKNGQKDEAADDGERDEDEEDDRDGAGASDDAEEADGGAAARHNDRSGRFRKRGGFERLAPNDSDGNSDGDDDGPLCREMIPSTKSSNGGDRTRGNDGSRGEKGSRKGCKKRSGRRVAELERAEDDDEENDEEDNESSPSPARKTDSGRRNGARSRTAASDADDDDELLSAQKPAANSLVGKRVEVCGLVSKADLNGRRGTASTFDAAKGRYRVRLEARLDDEEKVLAFKAENLRLLAAG